LRRRGPAQEGARVVDARLAEAVALARAIALDVVITEKAPIDRSHPATLLGKGKIDRIAAAVAAQDIGLVIVDGTLTPVQQRNLERSFKAKVLDRTGLILEIFGARARSAEGALQVELAHLTYQKSRLVRSWTHLERQRGGFGFLGGPGETQIEADRRLIEERIGKLKRELAQVARRRGLHRQSRQRNDIPVVALVGYTNAGKSSLFNRLTGAEILARDMLFATLDPTMRGITLSPGGRRVVLSDTVGFIRDLPTHLVVAFKATLEEVTQADIIVHVRDISHPDTESQKHDVLAVLQELGLEGPEQRTIIEIHNKIDRLPVEEQSVARQSAERFGAIATSAVTGEGLSEFLVRFGEVLRQSERLHSVHLGPAEGAALAWLHTHGEVVAREENAQGGQSLLVRLNDANWGSFTRRFAVQE
jgi:GTP-binding protein HflX